MWKFIRTACTSSISTVKSYVVKFIDWNTSDSVIGFPILQKIKHTHEQFYLCIRQKPNMNSF